MKKIIYIIIALLIFNLNSIKVSAQVTQIDHYLPDNQIDTTSLTNFCNNPGFENGTNIDWNDWHAAFGYFAGSNLNIIGLGYRYDWGIKSTGSAMAEIQNKTGLCSQYIDCAGDLIRPENNIISAGIPSNNASDYLSKNQIHHNIVSSGFDPIVPTLSKTHSGNNSLRLGNAASYNGFEFIEKKFTVTASNANFSFWYAAVMSNPVHGPGQDQYFGVDVYNTVGTSLTNITNTTGGVSVNVGSGTNTCYSSDAFSLLFNRNKFCTPATILTGGIKYRDWNYVSLNLSSQIGNTIVIRIWTRDCMHCGDFAYAYLDDFCSQPDGTNPTGSISIEKNDTCGVGQICVNYNLPTQGSLTGETKLFLNIYQNGALITTLNSGSTWLNSGSNFCFPITAALLSTLTSNAHFDYLIQGDFKIGSTILASQYIGNVNSGQDLINNNDYAISCPSSCACGDWGSIGYTINNKADKFLCDNTTQLQANQGDVFTLSPTYNCTGATVANACNAEFKYDVYFPNGGVLHDVKNIKDKKLDSCGITKIVMTSYCNGVACKPCEFTINVNCCNCSQTLTPILSWNDGKDSTQLQCGSTVTNQLDCNKTYSIKPKNPCGDNCLPDSTITTIVYPNGTSSVNYSVAGADLAVGTQTGNYTVSIKVKCNGVWCKECIIIFKQTKKCEPPCDNCKDKVQAVFNSSASNVTVKNFPLASTLNAAILLGGGADTYTQIRVNVTDIQVTSDNPACLQCYNIPNQWGSIISGSLSGFTPTVTTYSGVSALSGYNNSREIIFNAATPTAIPTATGITLNVQVPGVNALACCCIKVKLFLKITYRNNKCEECTKTVLIDFTECPGTNGNSGTGTFNQNVTEHTQYRVASPNKEDGKLINIKAEVINKK